MVNPGNTVPMASQEFNAPPQVELQPQAQPNVSQPTPVVSNMATYSSSKYQH